MRRWLAMGASFALLWLFVRGVDLVPRLLVGEFLIGLAVGLPIAFVFRRFYRQEIALVQRTLSGRYAVIYVVLFLWEMLTANVDVAYRVLAPWAPIEPDVIELPLRVQSDIGITTIANSITLTPGTLTMDYDADSNSLYVHAIDGRDPDAIVEPIRTWENYALRMFDEPLDPDDPVPRLDESAASSADTPGDGTGDTGGDANGE